MEIEYNEGQKKAIEAISNWFKDENRKQIFVLTGLAGTGKTTIVPAIVENLGIRNNTVYLSFTGKAAMVLNSKGIPAVTIHKLIYRLEQEADDPFEIIPTKKLQGKSKADLIFSKVTSIDNNIKLIVIDEASMISSKIMKDLLSFSVPILLIGDPMQLPPIEDDPKLLTSSDAHLDEIVRQEKDNPIILLSRDILEYGYVPNKRYGKNIKLDIGTRCEDSSFKNADQVLCYKNDTRRELNEKIRALNSLEGDYPIYGDKLICTKNNWDINIGGLPLINGTIGTARSNAVPCEIEKPYSFKILFSPEYTDDEEIIYVCRHPFQECSYVDRFDKELCLFDYGYAITVHKAQGSEYDNVIIYDDVPRKIVGKETTMRWLYTAVTRAKKNIIYVR